MNPQSVKVPDGIGDRWKKIFANETGVLRKVNVRLFRLAMKIIRVMPRMNFLFQLRENKKREQEQVKKLLQQPFHDRRIYE